MSSSILVIANHKGGVGKTTCSVNLAYELSHRHRVLLIDADPQGNSTTHLGYKKNDLYPTFYDVLLGNESLESSIVSFDESLDVVPAQPMMHYSQLESQIVVTNLLKAVKKDYDFIIFDCAPSMSLLSINCLVAADFLLTPIEGGFLSLDGLNDLIRTVEDLKNHYKIPLTFLGIIPNMIDWRNRLTYEVFEQLKTHFPKHVFKNAIPRNIRLAEAPSHGLPISLYDPNCAGAYAFERLAIELKRKISYESNKKKVTENA
jgi:chromosome partitioning protein